MASIRASDFNNILFITDKTRKESGMLAYLGQ